jgi:hypothetical protein
MEKTLEKHSLVYENNSRECTLWENNDDAGTRNGGAALRHEGVIYDISLSLRNWIIDSNRSWKEKRSRAIMNESD